MLQLTLNVVVLGGALWGCISCASQGNTRAAVWAACTAAASVNLIVLRLA